MLHAIQETRSVFFPHRTSWICDGRKITVRKTNHNGLTKMIAFFQFDNLYERLPYVN